MKIKILFIAFLVTVSVQSQNNKYQFCGEVTYKQSTHFSRDFSRDFTLYFNTKKSLYKEINIVKKKKKHSNLEEDGGLQLNIDVPRNNITPEFFYNDKKSFYFMEIRSDQELLTKEDPFNWTWSLKEKSKKIGGFNCQKATIRFRGRNYIAWFTQKIPIPFGPWKFKGLSGLILEIYDEDRVFYIAATKVKINTNVDCPIVVDKTKFKNSLTINEYLKKLTDFNKAFFAKLSSRLPKGQEPLMYDENCEDCSERIEFFNKK